MICAHSAFYHFDTQIEKQFVFYIIHFHCLIIFVYIFMQNEEAEQSPPTLAKPLVAATGKFYTRMGVVSGLCAKSKTGDKKC